MLTKSNIRVLSVCTSDVSGGAARAAYRIHDGMRAADIESSMLVKDKSSNDFAVHALSEFVPHNPIGKVFDWCATKWQNQVQHAQWRPYQQTKQIYFLSDLRGVDIHDALQKIDYDILHLHWINNRFIDIRELIKIHKPIVWTLHDSWPFCGVCHLPMDCKQYESHCGACPMLGSTKERDLAYEVFENKQAIYKKLDLRIVTPSRWLGECAKRSALFGGFPITVIPNCVDTEEYNSMDKRKAAESLGLNPDKRYILFGAMHATTDKNKGFDLLVEALQQLKDINAELIVYGTAEKLEKFNLPLPVHSLGYIHNDAQMAMIYNVADVMMVPSRSENLSNTIMESMACETPVVAFNIGGNSDMIDHEQNGYLAHREDSEDFTKGIQWCLDHNENNKLGKSARKKVLSCFTIEKVSEQYKNLYNTLCK